ncbi:MAG TPA: carbon-nitrogen hydrolase family protein [Candidatus Hydrogenedentes bacterium]|nr:carbon-nitrogen hydrolase family protein [Candidatus Hydrogenedentota bacterium]HIJ73072.1 carbon-nitrogen hydrolase family protein [Candidatus Hydrogenedentota bacterium]
MAGISVLCIPFMSVEGEVEANVDGALRIIAEEARKEKTDLVVLPELFTCGYCSRNLAPCAETVDGPSMQRFRACSKELGLWIGYGFAETHDATRVYNAWALIAPDGDVQVYRKTHLHPFEEGSAVDEREFLAAGETLEPFQTSFATVGVIICYDGCFVEAPRTLVLKGAELIVWPSRSGGYLASQSLPQVRALDNTAPVVQVDGGQQGTHLPIKPWSVAASAMGEVLVSQRDDDRPFRVAIDCDEGTRLRASIDAGAHSLYRTRRPGLYGVIAQQPTSTA